MVRNLKSQVSSLSSRHKFVKKTPALPKIRLELAKVGLPFTKVSVKFD